MLAPEARPWPDPPDTPAECRWQDGEVSHWLRGRAVERVSVTMQALGSVT